MSFVKTAFFFLLCIALLGCDKDYKTDVSFTHSLTNEVAHDSYHAVLKYEVTGENLIDLQDLVNKKMTYIKSTIDSSPEVTFVTREYNSYQYFDSPKKSRWVVFQKIELDSTVKKDLLKAVAEMQSEAFAVESLYSYLSQGAKELSAKKALSSAIQQSNTKLESIAQSFGKSKSYITNISVIDSQNVTQPMSVYDSSLKASIVLPKNQPIVKPVIIDGYDNVSVVISVSGVVVR